MLFENQYELVTGDCKICHAFKYQQKKKKKTVGGLQTGEILLASYLHKYPSITDFD